MEQRINVVTVRWWDGYKEDFRCTEIRFGSDLLWMRLENGTNRHIPLRQVRWFGTSIESNVWCGNIADSPDLDIERDCDHYSPMTNADRIRSMTDEELADFLVTVETYGYHDQSISGTYEMNEWLRAESEEKHGE